MLNWLISHISDLMSIMLVRILKFLIASVLCVRGFVVRLFNIKPSH